MGRVPEPRRAATTSPPPDCWPSCRPARPSTPSAGVPFARLRRHPHPGRHPRRAARHRLGLPLGTPPRPRPRRHPRRSSPASSAASPTPAGGRRRARHRPSPRSPATTTTSPAPRCSPSRAPRTPRSTTCCPSAGPTPEQLRRAPRAPGLPGRGRRRAARAAAHRRRAATSSRSARWPRSPPSSASPSPASRRCAPRPWCCCATRMNHALDPELRQAARPRPNGCAARRREAYFAAVAEPARRLDPASGDARAADDRLAARLTSLGRQRRRRTLPADPLKSAGPGRR